MSWTRKLLRVNLTEGVCATEPLNMEWANQFLGQRGLGTKVVVEDRCVGCKVCTIACPFGTVNYSSASGKVIKCDLCGGDPACASACPTEAITYIDADATGLDRMRQFAEKSLSGAAVN